eukprot:g1.t1
MKLSGTIPPDIGNLVKLTYLDVSDTEIEGTIPPDIGKLVKLTKLDVSYTKIEGTIPPAIGKLVKLATFDGSKTINIEDIGNLVKLKWLSFWYAQKLS